MVSLYVKFVLSFVKIICVFLLPLLVFATVCGACYFGYTRFDLWATTINKTIWAVIGTMAPKVFAKLF